MASMLLLSLVPGLVPGPWDNANASPRERAMALAAEMTLDEKLVMLHGPDSCGPTGTINDYWEPNEQCPYVGNVPGNTRLDIPPINMNDGPQCFRVGGKYPQGTSTAWPSGLTIAASWDVDAVHEWGAGMGKEFFGKGSNVQLGPGLCLARVPHNGRNFEYMSGEDPHLGATLVGPAIKGIQEQGVVANAKHWVLNNQETNRQAVDALASERARYELYYPPFLGAVKAGVGSFMCSYVASHETPTLPPLGAVC